MRKEGTKLTAGDIALNVVSVVLAFFSASFAGYMVMYGPPERSGNPRYFLSSGRHSSRCET